MRRRLRLSLLGLSGLLTSTLLAPPASAATDSYGWTSGDKCFLGSGWAVVKIEYGHHHDSRLRDYVYVPYAYKVEQAASAANRVAFEYIQLTRLSDTAPSPQTTASQEVPPATVKGATRTYFTGYDVRAWQNFTQVYMKGDWHTHSASCVVDIRPK